MNAVEQSPCKCVFVRLTTMAKVNNILEWKNSKLVQLKTSARTFDVVEKYNKYNSYCF